MPDKTKLQQIAYLRREYIGSGLYQQDLPAEPMDLFENWLKQACKSSLIDPTAMVVATVDKFGHPYQRIVLLKHYDKRGLVFYTNLKSRKAIHIKKNIYVSLLFPWNMLGRQIMVIGKAKRLSTLEATKYFYSRPRSSQISTWASKQSSYIPARYILESKFLRLKKKFYHEKIPVPKFWGGFRISIEQIEFWQGGRYRLHDRFLYQLENNRYRWKINRLSP